MPKPSFLSWLLFFVTSKLRPITDILVLPQFLNFLFSVFSVFTLVANINVFLNIWNLNWMDFVYKMFEKPVTSYLAGWLDNAARRVEHIWQSMKLHQYTYQLDQEKIVKLASFTLKKGKFHFKNRFIIKLWHFKMHN